MSLFSTRIPVNVQALLDQLPKNHFLHGITYDKAKNEVCILWEHEGFHTGLNVAVDFPTSDLERNRLPKGTRKTDGKKTHPAKQNAPAASLEPEKAIPVNVPDYQWSKERLAEELAKGPVEFQGLMPIWTPVAEGHKWQDGFFYRKCAIREPEQVAT